jgi:hypothetical protein
MLEIGPIVFSKGLFVKKYVPITKIAFLILKKPFSNFTVLIIKMNHRKVGKFFCNYIFLCLPCLPCGMP